MPILQHQDRVPSRNTDVQTCLTETPVLGTFAAQPK